MEQKTFTFKAPTAEEYKLLEAGVMSVLFIPMKDIDPDELYDDDHVPHKFESVVVKSPTGRKHFEADHTLTDICKPGYKKSYQSPVIGQKNTYHIDAVQHMYRVHIRLRQAQPDQPDQDKSESDGND